MVYVECFSSQWWLWSKFDAPYFFMCHEDSRLLKTFIEPIEDEL